MSNKRQKLMIDDDLSANFYYGESHSKRFIWILIYIKDIYLLLWVVPYIKKNINFLK